MILHFVEFSQIQIALDLKPYRIDRITLYRFITIDDFMCGNHANNSEYK